MLSRPPASLAAAMSRRPASRMLFAPRTMSPTRASGTIDVSPSLHKRYTSPASPRHEYVSTSTSGSGPSARVMIDRCGCSSASCAVSCPRRRISSTSEWSSVRRDRDVMVADVRGRDRRPHPGAVLAGLRHLVDARVGLEHALGEQLLRARRSDVAETALERLDGDLRRDLARLRAAHPVRDDEHGRAREVRVLVRAASAAGVRVGEVTGRGAQHHASS